MKKVKQQRCPFSFIKLVTLNITNEVYNKQ